mgnify:CR=1 FL=1|tara:strand:- start:1234 stop:2064 length:831 start_codon:yes stop_codon:yes gene_type:complete
MPVLTPLQPSKEGVRTDIAYTDLRKAIFKYGVDVRWEMAAVCPCQRSFSEFKSDGTGFTREPRPDCPECKGKGYIYHSAQTVRVIVHDSSRDPARWSVWGEHAAGSVSITLLPENLPSFLDRLTVLKSVFVYREVKTRSSLSTDTLRYPVSVRDVSLGDPADPTKEVVDNRGVLHCIASDVTGKIIQQELVENTDFTITDTGAVDWSLGMALGTAPSPDAHYSIQYYANPVYVVRSMPYNFRDITIKTKVNSKKHQELPTKVLAWLEFLGSNVNGD